MSGTKRLSDEPQRKKEYFVKLRRHRLFNRAYSIDGAMYSSFPHHISLKRPDVAQSPAFKAFYIIYIFESIIWIDLVTGNVRFVLLVESKPN